MMKGKSEESGTCVNDSAGLGTSSEYGDDAVKRVVDGIVYTPGFIRSLSGSEGNRNGIQIEVDLNRARAQPIGEHSGPTQRDVGLSQIGCSTSQPHIEFTGHIQSPNLRPTRNELLMEKGKTVKRKQVQKKQKKGKIGVIKKLGESSLNLRNGAVFRSTVATISLSIANETSRRRLVMSEAEASLQIGKALGLGCEGKEEEVLSKLEDLEA
ncbi:hypothetical protein CsSME_00011760 [Camellia sinensis var. sinensis]